MFGVDVRDRTKEFFAVLEGTTARPRPTATSGRAGQRAMHDTDASMRNFNKAAAAINRGIADSMQRLVRLDELAKQKSLFNDPAAEIEELTYVLKTDLEGLNAETDALQDYLEKHQPSKSQSDQHSKNVIATLRSEIANTTKRFTDILQIRSRSLQLQGERRKEFSSSKQALHRGKQTFGLRRQSVEETGDQVPLMQQQLVQQEDVGMAYLDSRVEAVESIEQTISEISHMYQRLATIVSTQHETAVRIDADMEAALSNMEAGHGQLQRYMENLSSSRWLILKVFATLILFAIFFILFVA